MSHTSSDPLNSIVLLLLDSRSPAGAHSHSGGLEAAVTAGYVRDVADVEDFCRGRLRTSGRVSAGAAVAAARLASGHADPQQWELLDAEVSARTPSPAARAASRQLGGGLRRLVRAMFPDAGLDTLWNAVAPDPPHHPLVLGAAVATATTTATATATTQSAALAARAAALGVCTVPASAAVRLLGLDPYAVHAMLARLGAEIDAVADEALSAQELPCDSAPALDLLADLHATTEVRLFAS
jgi:urease accessory protein